MFTVGDVLRFVGGRLLSGDQANGTPLTGAVTDSRAVRPGQLFVAYRGESLDGHDFTADACRAGAGALLVERPVDEVCRDVPQILVTDPRGALTRLANRVLARSCVETVIGVTGSAGKTTTRELLATVLDAGYPGAVLRPTASYNTDTGLSMTILNNLDDRHRYAVLEMGAQRVGEIAALCRLAPPRIGVVTNVGGAHLEFFGSLQGVAKAKGELIEALPAGGLAVLNGDDPNVRAMVFRSRAPAVLYGVSGPADYQGELVNTTAGGMLIRWSGPSGSGEARMRAIGRHTVLNALAAIAVAEQCGMGHDAIVQGLERFAPVHSRLQIRRGPSGSLLLDDSYNANRVSMLAGLAALKELGDTGRRLAVLGDMYELGDHAEAEHRAVGVAAASSVDRLIAFGNMARWIAEGARDGGLPAHAIEVIDAPGDAAFRSEPTPRAEVAASRQALAARLATDLREGDVLLVKAARGMRLDYLVQLLAVEQLAVGSSAE